MNSKEYWQTRTEENAKLGDKTSAQLLSSMQNVYNNSYKAIEKEIQAFYGRYATVNNLSITEVKKRLNPSELKSAKESIKQYYDFAKPELIGPDMSKEYRDELRLLSAKAYMSRLEELKMNLKHEIIKLGIKEKDSFDNKFKALYEHGYSKGSFDVDKFLKFSSGFESPTSTQIQKLINERWLGDNYSDRIWKNKAKLLNNLENTFLSGVARGQNALKIASEMHKDFDTSLYNCQRLARTESMHILNEATFQAYKDKGVTQYEFVTTLDEKTCPECGALDGQHFELKEKMEGVNFPVLHPNCRCGTVPYFEKDEIDKLFEENTRVARDGEGGIYYVPDTMNYTKWLDMTKSKSNMTPEQVAVAINDVPFKKKEKEMTYVEDMRATNPNYIHSLMKDEGYEEYQYTENCQRCAPTYEYRRRGYMVEALPKISKEWDSYMFTHEMWRNKDNSLAVYESVKSNSRENTLNKLIEKLEKYDVGSRFEILVDWKYGGGHAFNGEIIERSGIKRVQLICPQTSTGMKQSILKNMSNPDGLRYMYLNDKYINTEDLKKIMKESDK